MLLSWSRTSDNISARTLHSRFYLVNADETLTNSKTVHDERKYSENNILTTKNITILYITNPVIVSKKRNTLDQVIHEVWVTKFLNDGNSLGVWQWRPQTTTATNHDDQEHNLSNDVVNLTISSKYAVSFSRIHCCGHHGIGPYFVQS